MNFKITRIMKYLPDIVNLVTEVDELTADKQITVQEAWDFVKNKVDRAIEEFNLGDNVLLDLDKDKLKAAAEK